MATEEQHPVTVSIIDPDDLGREGLAKLLTDDPRFAVRRATRTVRDAQLSRLRPDIVCCDPAKDGELDVGVIAEATALAPSASICVFTTPLQRQAVIDAMRAGAQMYLLKGLHDAIYLLDALAFLAQTGMMIDPEIASHSREAGERIVVQQPSPLASTLSTREIEVLRLYSYNERVGEIAQRLHIDHRTVSNHLANARRKLGAGTNPELVRLITEQGLLGA